MPDKYFMPYEVAPRVYSVEISYTYKSNDDKFVKEN